MPNFITQCAEAGGAALEREALAAGLFDAPHAEAVAAHFSQALALVEQSRLGRLEAANDR